MRLEGREWFVGVLQAFSRLPLFKVQCIDFPRKGNLAGVRQEWRIYKRKRGWIGRRDKTRGWLERKRWASGGLMRVEKIMGFNGR